METVLVEIKKKSDLSLFIQMFKKMGMKTRTLTPKEVEDWSLAHKIDVGMKSPKVSRKSVMDVLSK